MSPPSPRLTGWRRIASAMWPAPADPQIYGMLDVEATAALAYIAACRSANHHVTITHLVGRALAHGLRAVPDLNVQIRGDRMRPRPSIDIFFITAVAGGHDLSGIKVERVDQRSARDVAAELDARAGKLKRHGDAAFVRTKRLTDHLPHRLLRTMLRATAYLTNNLRLDIAPLALHPCPFGSAMVTSVGMFGLPHGFAPLAWMYDVPLLVLVGEVAERPQVVAHQVVVRPVIPITATIDHRYVDGWHLSRLMRAFRAYLEDPASFEPPVS